MYSDLLEPSFVKKDSPIWGEELRNSNRCKKNDYWNRNGRIEIEKNIYFKKSIRELSEKYNNEFDSHNHSDKNYDSISEKTTTISNNNSNYREKRESNHKEHRHHNKKRKNSNLIETNYKVRAKKTYYRSRSRSISTSIDSIEEYRRSRSCERKRRHQQYLTIQKYGKNNGEDNQVFWDGFQWVKKGHGLIGYDQLMNATRRARRLHVGNLPTHITLIEEDFRLFFWGIMKLNNLCHSETVCPIVHVWFAKDRGGNFGFVEMASVEEAIAALRLDGTLWHGSPITINRPTDWKKSLNDEILKFMTSTSGIATAESLASAIHQAVMTGNYSGLTSVLSKLPESDRLVVEEMIKNQNLANLGLEQEPSIGLPVQLVKNKIRAELLTGVPSRIVKIAKPFSKLEKDEEYYEVLEDVMQECSKYGGIIAALIVTSKIPITNENCCIGDIFLEFASINQADNCILNLSGRLYEGKPVQMIRFSEYFWRQNLKFYSEDMFKRKLNMVLKYKDEVMLKNLVSDKNFKTN